MRCRATPLLYRCYPRARLTEILQRTAALFRPLAAVQDRVLLGLVVLVLGYVALGAVVARRTPPA
jgi:hypothetical protein